MIAAKRWTVEIFIDEHDDHTTHAEARLHTSDKTHLTGHGTARRITDTLVPEIGDELAVAHALSELAHHLLHAAADDMEQLAQQRADLQG
jgi:hypothetical protein